MAPLPPAPGVIEVGLHWTIGEDSSAVTKLHFSATGGTPAQADLTTMAAAVGAAVNTNMINQFNGAVKLTQVTCKELTSGIGTQGSDSTVRTGSNANNSMPAQVCFLVNYRIGRSYRGGKPRSYFPPPTTDKQQDPQTLSSGGISGFTTALTAVLAAIVGHTFGAINVTGQVSVSYYNGGSWSIVSGRPHFTPVRRSSPQIDPVLSWSVAPKFGTQRRRMVR